MYILYFNLNLGNKNVLLYIINGYRKIDSNRWIFMGKTAHAQLML
jgi:hypothetical protein